MAGPGGGPPRRSHTKSRNGCEKCKSRHIRCDENFPQCHNCTKHKVRCGYNDLPAIARATAPEKPNLRWTPEVRRAIRLWKNPGIFPFSRIPNMICFTFPTTKYSDDELRLVYHVTSICDEMHGMAANNFTLWTRHIPTVGAEEPYVINALIAFAAQHMALLTSCPLVGNMANEHRAKALQGLQRGIGEFSPSNSDAVLAASLVLSWQATDFPSWNQLMQGTSTVIDAMDPWKHTSKFLEFIAEKRTFRTVAKTPPPDPKPNRPQREDLEVFQRTIRQLVDVETYIRQHNEDPQLIVQLAAFLKGARKVSPTQSIADQFDRLRPLRTWAFWMPVSCLQDNGTSPSSLLVIAHYYTAAIILERLFPDIGGAYLASLSMGPIEEIKHRLYSMCRDEQEEDRLKAVEALSLLEFPQEEINEFCTRLHGRQPTRTLWAAQFDPPDFYMGEYGTPPSTTTTPSIPYAHSPDFNHSAEDIFSLNDFGGTELKGGSGANSWGQLPSYGQFLNPPSPATPWYLSPASSSYGEGSLVYSDHDEIGPFDDGMAESSNLGSTGPSQVGDEFTSTHVRWA